MKRELLFLKRFSRLFFLLTLMAMSGVVWGQYIVDFEGAGETKTAYASGSVTLSGISWNMTEALIGTEIAEIIGGTRSARLRGYGTSAMTMLANKLNGVGTVSFSYRRYGTDTQVDWKVEYSTNDGSTWTQIGDSFTAPASNDLQTFSVNLNITGNIRIRIKRATESGTSNRRLNIDDISITDYASAGTPSITVSQSALTGFIYVIGSGPSAEQSFTVSGSNLTSNISIVPPTNYEISTATGGSFSASNPVTLSHSGGTVASTAIYVRLKAGLPVNTYNSEVITASSAGAENKTVTCSGSVTNPPPPAITVTPTSLSGFSYIFDSGPSAEQSFTISGSNLTNSISIAPPTNYEISTNTGGSFSATSPVTLNHSGGTVASTTIYVRLKAGLAVNAYNSEVITASSTGADSKTVTCSGNVLDPNLRIENFDNSNATASYSSNSFTGNYGITWSYIASRDGNNDANNSGIDLPALMLRRVSDNSSITSEPISGGIGNFSVKLYKGFTGGGNRQVELFINDISKGISVPFDNFDEHIFEVNNINIAGNFVIKLVNTTSSQIIIDDISWTIFGEGENIPPVLTNITQSPAKVTPSDVVNVSVDANDTDGTITDVVLNWGLQSGELSNQISMVLERNGTYTTQTAIPAQLDGAIVYYSISATDNQTATTTSSELSYSVYAPATYLLFAGFPDNGQQGASIGSFTIEARNVNNDIDGNFSGEVNIIIASGTGNVNGILSRTAIGGIATFNNISFDQPGTYTLQASSAGLTPAISNSITIVPGPALTELILPQYLQGVSGTNNNRLPFAFRVRLDNLLPNATYRYINQIVFPATDGPTGSGAGNVTYVNADNTFIRSTNHSFNTVGAYGTFTTDANGSFTGWFMNESTGNDRFAVGNEVFMRIRLNDGNDGTTAVTFLTTTNSVKVINFGTTANANQGTAIRAESNAEPKNFIFLYDNIAGTGRPLYGSSIETTGIDFSATTWSSFYRTNVANNDGAWGGIIPNMNPNGVKLIQENSLQSGEIVSRRTSPNGIWGASNTVNPTGGNANVIVLDFKLTPSIAVSPNALDGFTYVEGTGPSVIKSFVVSGSNINSGVSVIPPANYEISLVGGAGFEPVNSIFLGPNEASLVNASVFVRLKSGLVAGNYNDETIFISSEGVQTLSVILSGSVLAGVPEPTNHVSLFEAQAESFNRILVSWVDAIPQAGGYLIKGSLGGFENIIPPVDGIEESSTGLVGKVAGGVQSYAFENLNASTTYYFKIFPYNGSGSQINYKTGGVVPQASAATPQGPQMTEEILPLTMQGLNGTNNSRIPYAFRVTFSGLLPNATYKYINQAVDAGDGPTTAGAGNGIYVLQNGTFVRTTAASFTNAAQHAEFTTNGNGAYSGWFMLEPTGNARFTPGNEVFIRIRLNNGAGGTTATHYFTTQGITILGFGIESDANKGTGLRAVSNFNAKNFVFLYGANGGSTRPIAGTNIEVTGIDFASQTAYPSFYRTQVSGVDGAFGTIVPNLNVSGIRTIEERSLTTGAVVSVKTSADGQWGQSNTVNPAGGLSEIIVLDIDPTPTVVATPNALQGFTYVHGFGPSSEQMFTVSGTKLIANVVVTAPASFEISATGGSQFAAQNSLQIAAVDGVVSGTQIFVRLKSGLALGTYAQNLVVSSTDAAPKNVALNGTVEAPAVEPESHVTAFSVSVNSMTQLSATWIDALPPASAYLIKGNATGFASITAPSDGVAESDGLLVRNIAQGVQSFAFTGLNPETTYFFKIFPYNGTGNLINYKTDGLVPQASATTLGEVALNAELLPQYMQGLNGTNNNRLPFAFRVTISNLKPNSVYRYINQAVTANDGPTAAGAGNPIFTNQNNFFRSTNPSFTTAGNYGLLTTDANGRYTGWFMIEPTGNDRYTPGNTVFMRIRLNDGMGGTTASHYLTTEGVTVLNFGQSSNEVSGTGIRAVSDAGPKNFAFIYDNVNGFGRPLYGTSIETTGVDYATNTTYPAFYREAVAESIGSWGGIVPNLNPAGVRRVEERSLATGNIVQAKISDDGFWGQTNTANPQGGLANIIVLDLTVGGQFEKIAGQLKYFNEDETLIPSPDNNRVFYVQLFENGVPVRPRQMVRYNAVANLSSYFEFNNIEAGRSYTLRVWEQNPNNILGETWLWNNWGGVSSIDALIANYMGLESPEVDVFPWIKDAVTNSYTPYFSAVADVNSSGNITSLDALTILYRTMGLPETSPFPQNTHNFRLAGAKVNDHQAMVYPQAPDITFTPNGIFRASSTATSVYYEGQMPQIETGLNIFNVFFVAMGDMNASYNPVASKQTNAVLASTQTISANVGEEVMLPLILDQELNVAALNVGIRYDNRLIKVTSVEGFELSNIDHENGIVRIAWMDQNGRTYEKDNVLLSMKALVLAEIDNETQLSLDVETEFASPEAKVIDAVKLRSSALTTASDRTQSLSLEHLAYPNPFKETALISYLLPEAGQVTVTVFNHLGQEVATLANGFVAAGQHQQELSSNDLNGSGIYFYHIILEGSARSWTAKGTLVLTK